MKDNRIVNKSCTLRFLIKCIVTELQRRISPDSSILVVILSKLSFFRLQSILTTIMLGINFLTSFTTFPNYLGRVANIIFYNGHPNIYRHTLY